MSKLGKKPIPIPQDTKVKFEAGKLILTGPKGSRELTLNDKIFTATIADDKNLLLKLIKKNEVSKVMWGSTRSIINSNEFSNYKLLNGDRINILPKINFIEMPKSTILKYAFYNRPFTFNSTLMIKVKVSRKRTVARRYQISFLSKKKKELIEQSLEKIIQNNGLDG